MGLPLPRPYLNEDVLLKTRGRKVWSCIPVLASRCQGWTDDTAPHARR